MLEIYTELLIEKKQQQQHELLQ